MTAREETHSRLDDQGNHTVESRMGGRRRVRIVVLVRRREAKERELGSQTNLVPFPRALEERERESQHLSQE